MLVFVYGTLLSGEPNNKHYLGNSERMGNEVVSGFTMISVGNFPACIQNPNSEVSILGEVWKIDEETLKRLDYLEGYPHFYNRVEVDTFAGKAWMYCFPETKLNDSVHVISSGSWKEFVGKKGH